MVRTFIFFFHELKVEFNLFRYLPGEKEFHQISELGTAFLGTQVDRLTEFIQDKNQMDREEVHQSLKTISSFIIG